MRGVVDSNSLPQEDHVKTHDSKREERQGQKPGQSQPQQWPSKQGGNPGQQWPGKQGTQTEPKPSAWPAEPGQSR